MNDAGSNVRVATAQFFAGTNPVENLERCREYLRQASAVGARLLVLPENSNRVRDFASREECFDRAEAIEGAFVKGLASSCAELGMHAVVGVDLRGDVAPDVFIASVLFGSGGDVLHVHRKHTLWDYEYSLFTPGNEPYAVIDTEIGRLGLQICADGIIPETPRMLTLLGAQVLCNSLNSRGPDERRVHVPLRAMENRVWHISANTVGGPSDQFPWMGGSQIVSPDGAVLAVASEDAEELVYADINPTVADDKSTSFVHDILAWRRPDLYGDLVRPLEDVPVSATYGRAPDGPDRPLVVALCQVSWNHSDEWTWERVKSNISYAAKRGAAIGVLPELAGFARGAVASDVARAAERSQAMLADLQNLAAEDSIWLVASLVEPSGDGRHYLSAHLIGADGVLAGSYRKSHLDDDERTWATAGNDLPVFDTPLGRIGLMIGNEVWVPEVMRVLAVRGAEIVFHPCDWDRPEAADIAACERTEENRVFLVSVARIDAGGGRGSQVMRPETFQPGQPIAVMRYPTGYWTRGGFEEQLLIEVNLREANDKMMGNYLDPLHKRQPQLYTAMVETSMTSPR